MFKIVAVWANGEREIVDEAETREEAIFLVNEHMIAYGNAAKQVFFIQEWKMKITWQFNDGYAGGSRPQYTTIYDDELLACDNIEEMRELIDERVQQDFEAKGWYIISEPNI